MQRRALFALFTSAIAAATIGHIEAAEANTGERVIFGNLFKVSKKRVVKARKVASRSKVKAVKVKKVKIARKSRPAYKGREVVTYFGGEAPGTIVVKTSERALYHVLGGGKAVRYGVAVGKQGFSWSGTARVAMKAVNPRWTPPPEMIARTPKYAKWANGMPGGIPENPLGARALYLYKGRSDTGFRIHGTNAPSSIGTAASSGCIRMLNHEVAELYGKVRIGTKVIVR
jgi:lipoprotein-anchoring transpeptidase ErfK/SrfK